MKHFRTVRQDMTFSEFVQVVEENKYKLKNCLAYSLMLQPHTKEDLFASIQKEEERHFGELRLFRNMNVLNKHIDYTLKVYKYCDYVCIDNKKYLWQLIEKGKIGSSQGSSEQFKLRKREKAYLPTQTDCEKAIEELKRLKSASQISENEVLDRLKSQLKDKYALQDNWREETRKNFRIWYSKS